MLVLHQRDIPNLIYGISQISANARFSNTDSDILIFFISMDEVFIDTTYKNERQKIVTESFSMA